MCCASALRLFRLGKTGTWGYGKKRWLWKEKMTKTKGSPKEERVLERRREPRMKKVKKISTGEKILEAGGVLGDQIKVKTNAEGCSGTLDGDVQGH